jgi:hypothetical protein
MRNVSVITMEIIRTHFVVNKFFENLSLYEIRWKYIVDPRRP